MTVKWVLVAGTIALGGACTTGPVPSGSVNSAPSSINNDTLGTGHAGAVPISANDLAWIFIEGPVPDHIPEEVALMLLDSLSSSTPDTRKLHAKAITRIWNRCDGAVAEAVGLAALEYVTERPVEFFSLFPNELADQDMPIWADMIAQELLIDAENDPAGAADALAADLRARCRREGASKANSVERLRMQVQARIAHLTSEQ
jgi:hypothetical protein